MNSRMIRGLKGLSLSVLLLAAGLGLGPKPGEACSRVFLNNNKIAKIVVRSMDLPVHFPEQPRLVVFPAGMKRDCRRSVLPGVKARIEGLGPNSLKWVSKYGSVVMVGFWAGASDGLNEKGLSAHMLTLVSVKHEPKDSRPELSDGLWVQYVLDNFKSVKEVVQVHREGKFRLTAITCPDLNFTHTLGSHLAVEDSTGDSAVLEYVEGKLVIHHGPQYRVMTNDPPMEEMLVRMKKYKELGGSEPLPGDSLQGEYRFARLAAYLKYLPEPTNYTQGVAGAFSLMRIAQIPFRDPEKDTDEPEALWRGCQTNWVSAADLTHKVYYMNSSVVPSLGWVELKDLNLRPGGPVRILNPHDPKLGGNLAGRFKKWDGRIEQH